MPNIGETKPVSSIWPTKPGERPKPRNRPKPPEDKQGEQSDKQDQNKPGTHPRVDDYA